MLAFWAWAKPGNYNLLAQIPPVVSEGRSIQPAPSSLVPLLRFLREFLMVLSIVLLLLPGDRQDQGLPVPCLVEPRHSNFRLSFRLCWETQREKRKR